MKFFFIFLIKSTSQNHYSLGRVAENCSLHCVTSCARVCNCLYMYLEKRVFVCMRTLLLALCLGGGSGGGGR